VAKNHGTAAFDKIVDVKLTADGGYVMLGTTQGYLNRFDDIWMVKTDNQGFGVPATLAVNEVNVGSETFVVQVAPNPVSTNAALMIDGYEVISKAFRNPLQLKVYNALGRLVHVQNIRSGNAPLELNDVAAGILSYQLIAGNNLLATGKLVKINQ
jgi:hypothetical protein